MKIIDLPQLSGTDCLFKCGKNEHLSIDGTDRIQSIINASQVYGDGISTTIQNQLSVDPSTNILYHKTYDKTQYIEITC